MKRIIKLANDNPDMLIRVTEFQHAVDVAYDILYSLISDTEMNFLKNQDEEQLETARLRLHDAESKLETMLQNTSRVIQVDK